MLQTSCNGFLLRTRTPFLKEGPISRLQALAGSLVWEVWKKNSQYQ